MTHPLTVLVLTPSIGGYYFGELLSGLTREITSAGGRLVLVQTLEAGTSYGELGEPGEVGDFAVPVAWSAVDGVVAITTAVRASYLHQVRDSGIPVVLAGTRTPGFEAPLALPDNYGGTFTAVEHLIGHGHTRIGFVGNLAQDDVRDRYGAYREALATNHLTADPALLFAAPNNARAGGYQAARDVLKSPHRPTALMVATDRNAIGLMRVLTEAGLAIPRDMAIMGFDNIEAALFSTPSLSSVNQRFDETGALAGQLMLSLVRGEDVPRVVHTCPSLGIAQRDSCGCTSDGHHDILGAGTKAAAGRSPAALPTDLLDRLQDELFGALLTAHDPVGSPKRDAVLVTVRETERLLSRGDAVATAEIQGLMTQLTHLTSRPDILHRITGAMIDFVRQSVVAAAKAGDDRARVAGPAQISAALWQLQGRTFLRQAEAIETALEEQYVVDAGLLDAGQSDPRHLGWIAGTNIRAGALALWEDSPSSGRLQIVGTYDPVGLLPDLVGTLTSPEHFPPASVIALAQPTERGACIVVPVRTKSRDWGLLVVIDEIGTTAAREAYHHWAALLCASLESQRLAEIVRRSALYDALTGLPNRRLFLDRLEHSLALWRRSRTPYAVVFIDLDEFKAVNDTLGHQMGDHVLAAVGARIEQTLRAVDTGARFGGDEFAILLHDTDARAALDVAHRVQSALGEVLDLGGHEISIRASLGVATSSVEYSSAEAVLRDADAAMYQAKGAGRGTVAFFDAAMHAHTIAQQRLHEEVRLALEEDQFELHYQPIVNLATGRTDRFEALVRWRHPERGLVLPDEFLPGMQDTGLIVQLGHWILNEACRQLTAWGTGVVNVSINVSDGEFWHQDLLTHVLETLRRHDLAPDRITLEITEGVLMRRPEVALRIMREMHDAGLRLHIDDFGTGYSSLETLHRFPVDAFKIDRSFVHSLARADDSAKLIAALVALGNAIGVAVVAEGVETDEQLAFLREIGCATGQGYVFMPAVTGDRVMDLVGRPLGPQDPSAPPAPQITGTQEIWPNDNSVL